MNQLPNKFKNISLVYKSVSSINPIIDLIVTWKETLAEAAKTFIDDGINQLPDFLIANWQGNDDEVINEVKKNHNLNIYPFAQKSKIEKTSYCLFAKMENIPNYKFGLEALMRFCQSNDLERRYKIYAPCKNASYKINAQPDILKERIDDIYKIYENLADEESRDIFLRLIKFMESGDSGYMRISPYKQGRHPLVHPEKHGTIIIGPDVSSGYLDYCSAISRDQGLVTAFEPDPPRFEEAIKKYADVGNVMLENGSIKLCDAAPNNISAEDCKTNKDISPRYYNLDAYIKTLSIKPGFLNITISDPACMDLDIVKAPLLEHSPKLQINLAHPEENLMDIALWLINNLQGYSFFIGNHGFPHDFCLYAQPKSMSAAEFGTQGRTGRDRIFDLIDEVSLQREITETINPETTTIITFSTLFEEAARHYSKNKSTPDFILADWDGAEEQNIQEVSRIYKLKTFSQKNYVNAKRNKFCLYAAPSPEPWLFPGFMPLLEKCTDMGLGPNFQIDAASAKLMTWIRKANPDFIKNRIDDIAHVYGMLADEESRKIFLGALKCIQTGNPGFLRQSAYPQYQHPLVMAEERDIVIDGGLGTGGTTAIFALQAGQDGFVIGFEPLNKYFGWSSWRTRNLKNVKIEHLGLWSSSNTFYIADEGGGSHLSSQAAANMEECKSIALDEWLPVNNPQCSLIKLDIEGAERECLKGAYKTIDQQRPKLQISLYHSYDDYLDIPLWINKNFPEYKLYMGHHTPWYGETILYAICK